MELTEMRYENWIIIAFILFSLEIVISKGNLIGLAIATSTVASTTLLASLSFYEQVCLLIACTMIIQTIFNRYKNSSPKKKLIGAKLKIEPAITTTGKVLLNGILFCVKEVQHLEAGDMAIIANIDNDTVELTKA